MEQANALTPTENRLFQQLTKPETKLELALPDDASAKDLWRALEVCAKGHAFLDGWLYRLRPIIGKILLRFQENPQLYQELGYSDFNSFLDDGVTGVLGIKRSVRYEALQMARRWPDLDPDTFVKIGPKKMRILNEFASGENGNSRKLLAAATKMTVAEFQGMAEKQYAVTAEATVAVTIRIHTTKEIADQWREFVNKPAVHTYAASADHGRILEAMMISYETEIGNT